MIIDAKHWFSLSNGTGDIPRAVATLNSTNVLDLGAAGDAGEEMYLLVQVLTTFDSTEEDATLNVKLYTDSDVAMGTQVLMLETGVIAEATLVAGYRVLGVRLPKGMKRYARLSYKTETHDFTAGALHALLVTNLDVTKDVLRAS